MEELSESLNEQLIATFRFNYPYSERRKGGMDGEKVRLQKFSRPLMRPKGKMMAYLSLQEDTL